MDDRQLAQLLKLFDLSWQGYRRVRKGVKKRVLKHLEELPCKKFNEYLDLIAADQKVRAECRLRLTVSISRFFRDRQLWDDLEHDILPSITKEKKELRVWCAGCARGEEVFSFRIIWEQLKLRRAMPQLFVRASDLNPDWIAEAQKGVYTKGSLKEVSQEIIKKYFCEIVPGKYEVIPKLKENIEWRIEDIFQNTFMDCDLIFVRNNILTYCENEKKEEAFIKVMEALKDGGILVIGKNETLPTVPGIRLERFNTSNLAFTKLQS